MCEEEKKREKKKGERREEGEIIMNKSRYIKYQYKKCTWVWFAHMARVKKDLITKQRRNNDWIKRRQWWLKEPVRSSKRKVRSFINKRPCSMAVVKTRRVCKDRIVRRGMMPSP